MSEKSCVCCVCVLSAEDAAAGKKRAHIYPSFAPSCSLLISLSLSLSVCSSSRSRAHTHSHSISRVFCWQTPLTICAPPLCCFRCSVFVAYLSQSGDAALWQIKPTAINRRRRVYALTHTRGDLFCLLQSAQMRIYPMIATMPDSFHTPRTLLSQ
jgi:hypothetical protein